MSEANGFDSLGEAQSSISESVKAIANGLLDATDDGSPETDIQTIRLIAAVGQIGGANAARLERVLDRLSLKLGAFKKLVEVAEYVGAEPEDYGLMVDYLLENLHHFVALAKHYEVRVLKSGGPSVSEFMPMPLDVYLIGENRYQVIGWGQTFSEVFTEKHKAVFALAKLCHIKDM